MEPVTALYCFSGTSAMAERMEGVIVPQRNYDNLILSDEVLESIEKGEFHIYIVDGVDDAIEVLTGIEANRFHRLVKEKIIELHKRISQIGKRKAL